MIYLIAYDIEDDKLRKKVSDRLLADGLERVQYSVFIGPVKEAVYEKLIRWLDFRLQSEAAAPQDSIMVLRLAPHQVLNMNVLGDDKIDREMIAGTKNVLIIGKE